MWTRALKLLLVAATLSATTFHSSQGAEGSWNGSVAATYGPDSPLSTSMYAHLGEYMRVYVSGSVRVSGSAPWSGSDGTTYYGFGPVKPPHGYTHGIVMLKIGGRHIPIEGGLRSFAAPHEGPVSVYVNDDNNTDNQGDFLVAITIEQGIKGDADEDELDDSLEDQMLRAYAPEIRLDNNEFIRPTDVYWYLRNSAMINRYMVDTILRFAQAPYYPEWYLEQVTNTGQPSNWLGFPSESDCAAGVRMTQQEGPAWERVTSAGNLGIYGHVTPANESGTDIVIEYWMFFASNEPNVADFYYHEGDWEFYKVYLDLSNPGSDPLNFMNMRRAEWHGHGKSPALVVWDRGTSPVWTPYRNPGVDSAVIYGSNYPTMPQAHPPVLVEVGVHGFLPAPGAYCVGIPAGTWCSECDGDGISYIPTVVPNIGEAFRPRLGMEVITHFNGQWGASGDSPEGPTLKGQWTVSLGTNSEGTYVGKLGIPTSTGSSRGRISRPWLTVSEAVSATPNGGAIIIYPGTYSEVLTLSRPMKLTAPHGGVRIGP